MRIGMILDKTFPPDPRVENEAISLINNGYDVYLFSLKYDDEKEFEVVKGIKVVRYKSNTLIYKLSALVYTLPFYSIIMSKWIIRFLKDYNIEVIHVHDIRIGEAVFKANKRRNLPVVLDLHDNMPEIIKYYPHLQKFPGKQLISPKKWKLKEEAFIKKSTKVCTVSQEFIEEVVKRTDIERGKICLVPNTVLKSFYENPSIDESILKRYKDSFVLLYLGDTALRRGLRTAIESLTHLVDIIPSLKLVIVGENTTDYVLKELTKELNLEEYVDFEGWQDVKLFPSYIMASSICVSPLERNVQHDVAYANKLFQYMSFGKPVLVSNATAQKNLIEKANSGLVHEELNPKDLADKIFELYENPELQSKLGHNGKLFIEQKFHWELTSKKLVELYANLET